MKRDIYKYLDDWKNDKNRRPLIIRGARQVGKSYIVNLFGKYEFDECITLNFEKNPEYKDIFISLEPEEIIEKISLFTGKRVIPGKTLLFLDEVQECTAAIMSLRYFYEEKKAMHVIAAGSLLEFALASDKLRMPVGRIQYLFLFPLSFGEFLSALGEDQLREYIYDSDRIRTIPEALHNKLNEYLKKYFIIGGMPAVVDEYIHTRDMISCQQIQRSIIDTFLDDFAKYAKKNRHRDLQKIFNAVPIMVGSKFKYSQVDNTVKTRDLKEALELLEMAGVVKKIMRTSGAGIPLAHGANEKHYKTLFLDVGLMHSINGIYADTAQAKDYTAIFKGSVAEQFVGQELLAYQTPNTKPSLYYWAREAKNSSAEIDYLIQKDASVIPIEVKSGAIGRMKSLFMFLDKYHGQMGIKISQAKYEQSDPVTCFPMYAIECFIKNFPVERAVA